MAKALPDSDLPDFDEHTEIAHPPRKKVLLLTCMDYRLLDNVVKFMNSMNLENRYDQLVFAGASLGLHEPTNGPPNPHKWGPIFFAHLNTAIEKLDRDTRDIFILEHIDCGAYRVLHPVIESRDEYEKQMECYATNNDPKKSAKALKTIKKLHCRECFGFATNVRDHIAERAAQIECEEAREKWAKLIPINVRCFIMDLAGKVTEVTPK